jgi:dTDP-4-dehydrorhamnose reductase
MSAEAMASKKILLTGVTGQVGSELLQTLAPLGEIAAPKRDQLDLADTANDFRALRETIRSLQPRWIVNPAAYTAVDKAESEPDLAYAINRDAVRALGEEAQRIGASVIHYSTDYVFSDTGTTPYQEDDPTDPVSVYGASKLAGERALAATGAPHFIFRTSWVYGATGKNFLRTILKYARERDTLRIVADQYGAPTWSRDLARMTAAVIERSEASARGGSLPAAFRRLSGVYHAAGSGETTWHGFASEAVRLERERDPAVHFATIEPITTAEYPTPARRPENSRLNCTKLKETFSWTMPDWRDSLGRVLQELHLATSESHF